MKKYTIIYSMILLGSVSCKKLITVNTPPNQLASGNVFNDDKTALSAISGLYSQMIQYTFLSNTAMTIYPGESADEIHRTTSNPNDDEFSQNSISSTNATVSGQFWTPAYNFIYQANAIIEGANNSTKLSDEVKKQLLGEAMFLRSFFYFYLANLFGDVPLITQTSYKANAALPRSDTSEIYHQIVSDLNEAIDLLTDEYPSSQKARPNRFVAMSLLARVYLYRKEYKQAEEMASMVINSGQYHLVTDLNNVFLSNSDESIWQLIPVPFTSNSAYPNEFVPANGQVPSCSVDSFLLKSFESGDNRKKDWVAQTNLNGEVYYYPYKYKVVSGTNVPVTEYNVVFRLAELYLIRSESRVQLGNLAGAIADLDMIRGRAGLSLIQDDDPGISQSHLLDTIYHEGRIELCFEWGHRWLDLKRTGKIDEVLSDEKGNNWQHTDALYPIPAIELQSNPNLKQNPGYN